MINPNSGAKPKSRVGASPPRCSFVWDLSDYLSPSVSIGRERTLAATLENANGAVYVVSDAESRQLAAGEQIQKGERVRTAKDSNALLRLADGSTVEMRERSEFSVSENRRGVTVNLERGDVIVEAAKQHNGRLYVQTPDSLVSVKGTIFAVESGTKGSRVSVVEGEVEVNHAGKDETLLPGDQTTTSSILDKTSGSAKRRVEPQRRANMRISFRNWRN